MELESTEFIISELNWPELFDDEESDDGQDNPKSLIKVEIMKLILILKKRNLRMRLSMMILISNYRFFLKKMKIPVMVKMIMSLLKIMLKKTLFIQKVST